MTAHVCFRQRHKQLLITKQPSVNESSYTCRHTASLYCLNLIGPMSS